jgi:hypothetical protein
MISTAPFSGFLDRIVPDTRGDEGVLVGVAADDMVVVTIWLVLVQFTGKSHERGAETLIA